MVQTKQHLMVAMNRNIQPVVASTGALLDAVLFLSIQMNGDKWRISCFPVSRVIIGFTD